MELQQVFHDLIRRYDPAQADPLWAALEQAYTAEGRFYHNLAHLQQVHAELVEVHHRATDWDALLFTLFYHDFVYDVSQKDNEAQSAGVAEQMMQRLGCPAEQIIRCATQIRATQHHDMQPDADTNLFTDADLAILGQSPEVYAQYAEQIRREYAIYPDALYKPGRKNVLLHLLSQNQLYKTGHFHRKYEIQARENLKNELQSLE
jgi:predicted metal-dependent HD superfamily phosphohydrolase